jgi:hypothetical protein
MILTVAFILLSAIILWFVIGAKGQWSLKAACIAFTLYFSLSLAQSLPKMMGWPSTEKIPNQFEIHWGLVEEPDKITGEAGRIYLWLTSQNEDSSPSWLISFHAAEEDSPRAYSIPYSRDNHEKIDQAVQQIKAGNRVGGGVSEGEEGKEEGEGKEGEGQGDGDGGGSLSDSPELYFEPLPPPKLPEK